MKMKKLIKKAKSWIGNIIPICDVAIVVVMCAGLFQYMPTYSAIVFSCCAILLWAKSATWLKGIRFRLFMLVTKTMQIKRYDTAMRMLLMSTRYVSLSSNDSITRFLAELSQHGEILDRSLKLASQYEKRMSPFEVGYEEVNKSIKVVADLQKIVSKISLGAYGNKLAFGIAAELVKPDVVEKRISAVKSKAPKESDDAPPPFVVK